MRQCVGEGHHDNRRARARQVSDVAIEWVTSGAVRKLLDVVPARISEGAASSWLHLNEELPSWMVQHLDTGSTPEGLHELWPAILEVLEIERSAAERFNSRAKRGTKYVERFHATRLRLPRSSEREIIRQTARLGLVDAAPPCHRQHDRTLVLGGGFRSPDLRARYAAQLESSGVTLGELYFLGSPRPLMGDTRPWWKRWWRPRTERRVTDKYAPGATDEFDLMTAGAISAFDVSAAPTEFLCGCHDGGAICPRWTHANAPGDTPVAFTHERARVLHAKDGTKRGAVLSASTSRPPHRPDTSDTYALWARYANPVDGERLLVVTTQIFVPFQRFDALRNLYFTHGIEIDAVGYGAEWNDRPLTATNLLQETLSGIRSARRLIVSAGEILQYEGKR